MENKFGKDIKLFIYAPVLRTSNQKIKDIEMSHSANILHDEEDNIKGKITIKNPKNNSQKKGKK